MKYVFLAGLLSLTATFAAAHSEVDSTTPANGAELTEAPADILLTFGNPLRLTRVEMTHADHPAVTLDLGQATGFASEFTVPFDGMGAGLYRVEWRGLGADGHAMQGEFSFEVR